MLKRMVGNALIIVFLILNIGCSKEEKGLVHRKITGTFSLISVERSGIVTEPTATYSIYESIADDCDTHSTLEIKSNGTLELYEFSGDNCRNETVRNGTWKVTSTFYGSFVGEIQFDGVQVAYDIFENNYDDDGITKFSIEYYDQDPPENIENLRYHYTYVRADLLSSFIHSKN